MAAEIPDIVIGRLPIYLRALTRMAAEGDSTNTSSYELGNKLGISSAQIRKDLSHFGEFGKQGTGYNINYLIEQRLQILHLGQWYWWELDLLDTRWLTIKDSSTGDSRYSGSSTMIQAKSAKI